MSITQLLKPNHRVDRKSPEPQPQEDTEQAGMDGKSRWKEFGKNLHNSSCNGNPVQYTTVDHRSSSRSNTGPQSPISCVSKDTLVCIPALAPSRLPGVKPCVSASDRKSMSSNQPEPCGHEILNVFPRKPRMKEQEKDSCAKLTMSSSVL